MKKLYLLRHGKSDWNDVDLSDLDRPLKKRGVQNSTDMGILMREKGLIPDLLITSPALRAYDTAKLVADQLGTASLQFKVNEKLYLPDFPTSLKLILYIDNAYNSLMLVGHEPSISTTINYFINKPLEKVVTASLTELTFDCKDWRDLSPSNFHTGWHRNRHDMDGFELN